jgi:hypothetical protein
VRTWWFDVIIDERLKDVPDAHAALGWIPFAADGPQPSIHLRRSNAEGLLLRTRPRPLARTRPYLLRSKEHTPHGLMQAVRSSDEFFRISRDGFEPKCIGARSRGQAHSAGVPTEGDL